MDNKATTKRMIGAVVLVLVAALLLAWLLKGKNRDGQQDLAMNQTADTKPILGFPGVVGDDQKPTIVGDDPNAAAQQQGAGIDVAQQAQTTGTAAGGANLIPGVDVKLPNTVSNTTGFDVRPGPGGEVRDLVDTDGKVKDGTGSLGTGDAKASTPPATGGATAPAAGQQTAAPADTKAPPATTSASQKDKPATNTAAPEEKKPSSKVVLVNEKPVPRAVSEASAKKAAEEKAAAAKAAAEKAAKAVADKAAATKAAVEKVAAEKVAAAKSVALASGTAAAGTATGGAGSFAIQLLASADKAKADAAAGPLKADGHNVMVSTASVGGKTIYRVNVTGFADRAAAEAAQAKMKSRYKQNQTIQGSFVTSSK